MAVALDVAGEGEQREVLVPFPPFEEFLRAQELSQGNAVEGVWGYAKSFTLPQGQRIDLWLHLAALYGAALEIIPPAPPAAGKRKMPVCPLTGCSDPNGRARTVLWQLRDGRYCRISEDGSLSSVPGDIAIPRTPGLRVTPVHPWDMTEEVMDIWGPLASDYKLLLPPWQAVESAEVRAVDFWRAIMGIERTGHARTMPHKLGWKGTELPPSFDREGWHLANEDTLGWSGMGIRNKAVYAWPERVYAWPNADRPNFLCHVFEGGFRRGKRGSYARVCGYGIRPILRIKGTSSVTITTVTLTDTTVPVLMPRMPGAQIVRQVSGGHACALARGLLIVRTQRLCAEAVGESMEQAILGWARGTLRKLYVWNAYNMLEAAYLLRQPEQQLDPAEVAAEEDHQAALAYGDGKGP